MRSPALQTTSSHGSFDEVANVRGPWGFPLLTKWSVMSGHLTFFLRRSSLYVLPVNFFPLNSVLRHRTPVLLGSQLTVVDKLFAFFVAITRLSFPSKVKKGRAFSLFLFEQTDLFFLRHEHLFQASFFRKWFFTVPTASCKIQGQVPLPRYIVFPNVHPISLY